MRKCQWQRFEGSQGALRHLAKMKSIEFCDAKFGINAQHVESMLSKYSSTVGGVTRIFMSVSQTEMHTLSVVSVLISGKLTDGCVHSRPLVVKRSEFVNGALV